ncbi:glycosyltransferase [Sporomusa aerivorans]|uniref:tetratricopeptide repeat-containing glycosyltransferase family 2 protein n=1 Tax=Sporomusa aerivorans TaxID=204936 RepID=UPI00352B58B7
MSPTITLAMIVRNEAKNLACCLESVKTDVDEIIIVDTGSTDQTREIAARYTDKIYHYTWNGDFSAARNFAIGKSSGEWILSLDADEFLDSGCGSLRDCIADNDLAEFVFLPLRYMHAEQNIFTYDQFLILRLFRNLPQYRFAGAIHEQLIIPCAETKRVARYPVIWHQATPLTERNKKRNRNVRLLKKACANEPDNLYLKYYLGIEWLGFGKIADALPLFKAVCDGLPAEHVLFRAPAVSHYVLCLRHEDRPDEALAVCIKECKQYSEYTDLFFDAGSILAEQGEYQQAISWFNTAVAKGKPPLEFVHTHGVESFLAYDHLGHCHEASGDVKSAEYYYRQAFQSNNEYTDCLLHLFFLQFNYLDPDQLYNYFRELGCYRSGRQTQFLGALFLMAGLPAWAAACYEEFPDPGISSGRIKSMVFGGEFSKAAVMLNIARQKQVPLSFEAELYEMVAAMLAEEYTHAHKLALTMWRTPAKRSAALAVLLLLSKCTAVIGTVKPEEHREPEIAQTLLVILDGCLLFREKDNGASRLVYTRYVNLAEKTLQALMTMTAAGCMVLSPYLKQKSQQVYRLLTTKLKADAVGCFYHEE